MHAPAPAPRRPPLSTHGRERVVRLHAAPSVHVSEDRIVIFEGPEEKAAWLDSAASLDATTPEVRAVAKKFVDDVARSMPKTPRTSPAFLSALAHEVHHWVRDHLAYEHDPGGREEFADTATILTRGYDDCDGKCRAFVAIIRAIGAPLEARIRPIFDSTRDFVHVQAEVRWPGSEREKGASPGGWLLAECILKGVELGEDPEQAPRDASGRRILAGPG